MFYDTTYILVLIGLGLSLLASGYMNHTFSKYSKVISEAGITGSETAKRIMESQGVYGMPVQHVGGNLTDHYDPRSKSLSLSDSVYKSTSIAAIAVAAHECGHALQDREGYSLLAIRTAIVPVANLGSRFSWYLVLAGLIIGGWGRYLMLAGIICFMAAVLFQVVTLPVEINASRRGLALLEYEDLIPRNEIPLAQKVLIAAALTYVAGTLSSLLQLLRLILLFQRRDQ